jgi:hypothetical protein
MRRGGGAGPPGLSRQANHIALRMIGFIRGGFGRDHNGMVRRRKSDGAAMSI